MNVKPVFITSAFFLGFLFFLTTSASANSSNNACESLSVKVDGISIGDESQLQTRIDKMENQLRKLRHSHGRGSRLSRSQKLHEQLDTLEVAMQSLHDKQYLAGCKQARLEASESARISKLENSLTTSSK